MLYILNYLVNLKNRIMEKTNLWPAPLDDKNLMDDWITDELQSHGVLETPNNKNGLNQFLTFIYDTLICVTWRFGENHLRFDIMPDLFGAHYPEEKRNKAKEYIMNFVGGLEDCDNGGDQRITVKYTEDKESLDFFFYWANIE